MVFGAPKLTQGRFRKTSFLAPFRLIAATGLALWALWLFWSQQGEYLQALVDWLGTMAQGAPSNDYPEIEKLYPSLTHALSLAMVAGILTPIALWRWVSRYMHGAVIAILLAGVLTSYDFEGGELTDNFEPFMTLAVVFGLGVLKRALLGRAFFISENSVERLSYNVMNWTVIVLSLICLFALIGMVVVTRYQAILEATPKLPL